MTGKTAYTIEHMSWGDDDERTGWYLMRLNLVDQRKPGADAYWVVVDKIGVAKFNGPAPVSEVTNFDYYCRQGCRVLPRESTMDALVRG